MNKRIPCIVVAVGTVLAAVCYIVSKNKSKKEQDEYVDELNECMSDEEIYNDIADRYV